MSLDENISLVEGDGSGDPTLMDGGPGATNISPPRKAWEERMSLDSESGRGSGYPGPRTFETGTSEDNVVSIQEMSGGTDFWSRNGGGAPTSTGAWSEGAPASTGAWSQEQEIAELKEQLAEEKLQHKSEVSKLKTQLEVIQVSETVDTSKEGESELEKIKKELMLANEKIYEYEQELLFNGMLSCESPSSSFCESVDAEGKGSAELRAELNELKETLGLKEKELREARDSLHRSREQVVQLGEKANNPNSMNMELERLKELLSVRERELKESREVVAVGERGLEETRERFSHRDRELEETRGKLSCKERELEVAQESLQSTLEQLELAKRDVSDGEKKPTPSKTKLEEQRRAKLNKVMEEAQKYRKEATNYQKKYRELADLNEKMMAEKGALECTQQSEMSKLTERLGELECAVQTKKTEMAELRKSKEESERDLKQAHSQHQKEILDLESRLHQDQKDSEFEKWELSAKISQLEEDKQTQSATIGKLERANSDCEQQIDAHREKEEGLKQNLEVSIQQKNHTVQQLQQETEKNVKARERITEVEQDRSELQTQIFTLNEEKNRLATEKLDVEEVCGEFKDEAEKTMVDYNKLAGDYKQACKDRDEFRTQRQNAMSTLAKRNSEIEENKKKIKDLDNELAAMREQLLVYDEGFKTERTSREKAVKQIKELDVKVKALEKDKKELQDQINRQSASQFHREFSDYNSPGPSPITSPRGVVSPRGGPQYAASPGLPSPNGANFPGPGSGSGQRH